MIGVEHEYSVFEHGSPVDFRGEIHRLEIPGLRVDPGDPHAYRTTSGLKITCDGPEAEIATPPLALAPNTVEQLIRWTGFGARALTAIVAGRLDLEGVSTHLSVSIDNAVGGRAAGLFSRTFAPALMLLMDGAESPGLLVRPRHGRLEFGGEFVIGDNLAAAIAMALGGAIVCERAAHSFRAKSALPPPIRVDVVPAVDRYGWFVARDAFGVDLYATGRTTELRRELMGTITAQRCLESAWHSARRALMESTNAPSLTVVDSIVAGDLPIPLERAVDTGPPTSLAEPDPVDVGLYAIESTALTLRPVAATWDFVVYDVNGTDACVSVPLSEHAAFVSAVEDGSWDGPALGVVAESGQRRLQTYHDAMTLDVWAGIDFSEKLAPPERLPDGTETLAVSPRATEASR